MTEERRQAGAGYTGYEYREISVPREYVSLCLDSYPCFGWEEVDGKTVFYIHKNRGGLFEELVKADPCVGFELDGRCSTWLDYEKKMCNMDYASIVGRGRMRVVGDEDERFHGMDLIMRQYGHGDFEYERRAMAAINIWALDVEELTMKATKGWREGNVVG